MQNPSEVGEASQQMLLPQGYAYLPPAPSVDSIAPSVATAAGGTEIRILGDAFTDDGEAPVVRFGDLESPAVTRVSDTELLARTPPLEPGTYDVEIEVAFSISGTATKSVVVQDAVSVQAADQPAPVVASVCDVALADGEACPALPLISATERPRLFVQGSNFTDGATVRLGTRPAVAVTFISATQLEVDPPDNPLGILSLSVINPDGQSSTLVASVSYVEECELTEEGCPFCGNGRVDVGEDCDSTDLNGGSCVTTGFASGTLGCAVDCSFDVSQCEACGNGRIDDGEQCDGETTAGLAGRACADFGFSAGDLGCTPGCSFDFGSCRLCGNSFAEGTPGEFGAEVCDRTDLRGATCESQGFVSGTLACQVDCTGYDTSGCTRCGDGFVDPAEQCDGANLDGQNCESLLDLGGTLACNAFCEF
ncbi:MAG: IPT/TIG domain-containing protein, partial [Myxococcota bacterium]